MSAAKVRSAVQAYIDTVMAPARESARRLLDAQLGELPPAEPSPDPEWDAFVRAYGRAGARQRNGRPTMLETALEMGDDTEKPLRRMLHARGITDYRSVHAMIRNLPR